MVHSTSNIFRNSSNPLIREESERNLFLRDSIGRGSNILSQAPISKRLFMIIREMPSYLSMAYSLRYRNVKPEAGMFAQMKGKISRYSQLVQEILYMRGSQAIFARNVIRLDSDFDRLNSELDNTQRAICAYFVSNKDSNGAILGDHLYYYHHYKINKFKQHFDVSAKVVRSTKDMFEHLNKLKANYPDRPIKVVDIVAHGSSNRIVINHLCSEKIVDFQTQHVGDNEFGACASDAAIILDACSTGVGGNSIAQVIAEKNPGKIVFAPNVPLFFSKPVFKKQGTTTIVNQVIHGFAVVCAYTSRKFQVADIVKTNEQQAISPLTPEQVILADKLQQSTVFIVKNVLMFFMNPKIRTMTPVELRETVEVTQEQNPLHMSMRMDKFFQKMMQSTDLMLDAMKGMPEAFEALARTSEDPEIRRKLVGGIAFPFFNNLLQELDRENTSIIDQIISN